ncbi:MAG: hypothetical protein ACYC44_03960 [Patescibacteria group bacterium]
MPPGEPRFELRQSILERKEIIAPPNYVSVFHETKTENIPSIDKNGLTQTTEFEDPTNIDYNELREILDDLRPEGLKKKGISRKNVFAYPYLKYGHGMSGAAKRFMPFDEKEIRFWYKFIKDTAPEELKELGVKTVEEYLEKNKDPEYLKLRHPGEVLEMKVDPQKCYVGDLENITDVASLMFQAGRYGEEELMDRAKDEAKEYWTNLVSLEDFLKWYQRPERNSAGDILDNSFFVLKGAPAHLVKHFNTPEILVPGDIPQEHIRVLE